MLCIPYSPHVPQLQIREKIMGPILYTTNLSLYY